MNTTFHFASAQEISTAVLDAIRQAYQEKPISIYIKEDSHVIPDWQMQEVRRRDIEMKNDSAYLLNCDAVIDELERELEYIKSFQHTQKWTFLMLQNGMNCNKKV